MSSEKFMQTFGQKIRREITLKNYDSMEDNTKVVIKGIKREGEN
jgi:hypothetical protein